MKRSYALLLIGLLLLLVASTACATPTPAPTVQAPTATDTIAPAATDTATPAPTITLAAPPAAATATPQATLAAGPQMMLKRIEFAAGATSATVQDSMPAHGLIRYAVQALATQTMTVVLTPALGNSILTIATSAGQGLLSDTAQATQWSGVLPTTGDVYVNVVAQGDAPASFTLQVSLSALPTITPKTPAPTATAKVSRQRIVFQPGATSASVAGRTATPGMDSFVLRALAGQTMTVKATSALNNVILIIYGADGNVLISDHAGATQWSGSLPATQDYFIDTRSVADAKVDFTLQVTISPLPQPTPGPQRIQFPANATAASVSGTLPAHTGVARYVLKAQAGQTMTVQTATTTGQVILIIWGADGNVLISDHAGATSWSGLLPATQDYYIDVRSVGNVQARFTMIVTIPPK